jgi:hypothetical protein
MQGAVIEQLAGDVVQPQALAEIVQLPGRFHGVLLGAAVSVRFRSVFTTGVSTAPSFRDTSRA